MRTSAQSRKYDIQSLWAYSGIQNGEGGGRKKCKLCAVTLRKANKTKRKIREHNRHHRNDYHHHHHHHVYSLSNNSFGFVEVNIKVNLLRKIANKNTLQTRIRARRSCYADHSTVFSYLGTRVSFQQVSSSLFCSSYYASFRPLLLLLFKGRLTNLFRLQPIFYTQYANISSSSWAVV
jgi:hypothetical protein